MDKQTTNKQAKRFKKRLGIKGKLQPGALLVAVNKRSQSKKATTTKLKVAAMI